MSDLMIAKDVILPMSLESIEKVRRLETESLKLPQTEINTLHTFHAGIYARTVKIPAGIVITGALIKIPTVLIISGDVIMFTDGEPQELHGYHVFSASAGRKQAFVAMTDVYLTMIFSSKATNAEEAEWEFTDEAEGLASRKGVI